MQRLAHVYIVPDNDVNVLCTGGEIAEVDGVAAIGTGARFPSILIKIRLLVHALHHRIIIGSRFIAGEGHRGSCFTGTHRRTRF